MRSAIVVDNVRKIYAGSWRRPAQEALRGITLNVDVGETFGFVGPNGAGKSTLIKVLLGAFPPSAGRASIFGVDVREPRARRGLGFVPENPSLPDFLTPYEVLLMGLRLHRVGIADERSHCLGWLDRFNLATVAHSPLRGFSKGMMQRAALAHALAIKPRLLILDEPLSGLDPIGRKDVVDILDEYRRDGGTLFFSSHVLHDVEAIADRFGLIHQGQLLTIRSPQEVVADQADRYVLRYRAAEVPGEKAHAGLHVLEASPGELANVIARVQAQGGVIQDLKPKASLEAVFFRTIAASPDVKS
jgi:ABC-2 type transport system ATP-binding protein